MLGGRAGSQEHQGPEGKPQGLLAQEGREHFLLACTGCRGQEGRAPVPIPSELPRFTGTRSGTTDIVILSKC